MFSGMQFPELPLEFSFSAKKIMMDILFLKNYPGLGGLKDNTNMCSRVKEGMGCGLLYQLPRIFLCDYLRGGNAADSFSLCLNRVKQLTCHVLQQPYSS